MSEAIYAPIDKPELRQGEIVTGIINSALTRDSLLRYLTTGSVDNAETSLVEYGYAVIMTQDCDLLQDYNIRTTENPDPKKLLQNVLFCSALPADFLCADDPMLGSTQIKKQFRQNKMERLPIFSGL